MYDLECLLNANKSTINFKLKDPIEKDLSTTGECHYSSCETLNTTLSTVEAASEAAANAAAEAAATAATADSKIFDLCRL